MVTLFVAVVPYYRMQALAYVVFVSSASLYRALGEACVRPDAGGERVLRELAAVHAPLLAAATSARRVYLVSNRVAGYRAGGRCRTR